MPHAGFLIISGRILKDIHFRVDGDILRVYNVTEFVKKQQESSADCGK